MMSVKNLGSGSSSGEQIADVIDIANDDDINSYLGFYPSFTIPESLQEYFEANNDSNYPDITVLKDCKLLFSADGVFYGYERTTSSTNFYMNFKVIDGFLDDEGLIDNVIISKKITTSKLWGSSQYGRYGYFPLEEIELKAGQTINFFLSSDYSSSVTIGHLTGRIIVIMK